MTKDEILESLADMQMYTAKENNTERNEMVANLYWINKKLDKILDISGYYVKNMKGDNNG